MSLLSSWSAVLGAIEVEEEDDDDGIGATELGGSGGGRRPILIWRSLKLILPLILVSSLSVSMRMWMLVALLPPTVVALFKTGRRGGGD